MATPEVNKAIVAALEAHDRQAAREATRSNLYPLIKLLEPFAAKHPGLFSAGWLPSDCCQGARGHVNDWSILTGGIPLEFVARNWKILDEPKRTPATRPEPPRDRQAADRRQARQKRQGSSVSGTEWKLLDKRRWSAQGGTLDATEKRPPSGLQRRIIEFARTSMLRRGVFRATLSRLIFLIGGGRPLDIGFRDAMFRLEGGRNLIEYGILLNPAYNAEDIDFLLGAVSEGGVFVDIGCNIGLYSLPLARAAGPTGRCVSIDANPLMIERLARNAALSGLSNVTSIASAVSDRDGSGHLAVRKNDDAIVAVEETGEGPIPVRLLAALLVEAGITSIDGLKIDIEGHEDKALVPFIDNAARTLLPRRIVIEHPEPQADYPGCTAAFARRGYQLVGRTRNNSLYSLVHD